MTRTRLGRMLSTHMLRRVAALVTVALVPLVYVALNPAGADRLDFLCSTSTPAPPGSTTTTAPVLEDSGIKVFDGINFIFTGHAPPGVKVKGVAPDPVTKITNFTQVLAFDTWWRGVDFLDSADVPGADGPEVTFLYEPQYSTKGNDVPTQLHELFHDNFNIPYDLGGILKPNNNISIAGIKLTVVASQVMKDMAFKAEISFGVRYKLTNKQGSFTRIGLALDSTGPGYKFPSRTQFGIAFKHDAAGFPVDYLAVHQNVQFWGVDPAVTSQPGVGLGVVVDTLKVDSTNHEIGSEPLFSAKTTWSHTPRSFAFGARNICKPWDPTFASTSHLAWNIGGLIDPANTTLGVEMHIGIGAGLAVRLTGPAGSPTVKADKTTMIGTISKVPARLDAIIHPDSLGITRSTEIAPTIDLQALDIASDDPTTTKDLPMHAEGRLVDLPRHVLMTAGFKSGSINRTDISMWNLRCPTEPAPMGTPAPADVQRNDITDTLPLFPAGCTRYALTPGGSTRALMQNFLPQDLNARDATSDLSSVPASGQFAYDATRNKNPLSDHTLYRMGGQISGLTRVVYDASSSNGIKAYVQRADPTVGADDSAAVVLDRDSRSDFVDEIANTGTRIQTNVTVADLPSGLRIDQDATETTDSVTQVKTSVPVHVAWRATSGIALRDGTAAVQMPGSTARRATARFETGQATGALPPAGDIAYTQVTAGVDSNTNDIVNAITWRPPAVPSASDAFPTPVVPAYSPDNVTRVHLGGVTDTAAQRGASPPQQLRAHADVDVPQDVAVTWATRATKDPTTSTVTTKLVEAVAQLCTPGSPSCALTRLDATAVQGPAGTGPADLLVAPTLPAVPTDAAPAITPFTNFRPGSGVRAIIPAPGQFGIDGVVRGVAYFRYRPSPQDVTLKMGATGPQPFRLNLLDATGTSSSQPQILFADAALDRLSSQLRAILRDSGTTGVDTEPWLWVNTDDVTKDSITAVDFSQTDAPGTMPVLSGVLRFGDRELLTAWNKTQQRPTSRTPVGADVTAHIDTGSGRKFVNAVTRLEIPRHVAIWLPANTRCAPTSTTVDECQSNRLYEVDDVNTITMKTRTTAASLGDIDARVRIVSGSDLDLDVVAHFTTAPGSVDFATRIARNQRLSWTAADLTLTGNTNIGRMWLDVYDNTTYTTRTGETAPKAVGYRRADGSFGGSTPNYAVEFVNVGTTLTVTGRLKGIEPRLSTPPADPNDPNSGGHLGYVHLFLNLQPDFRQPKATNVTIDAYNALAGNVVVKITGSGNKIGGFINARMDHVEAGKKQPEQEVSAFQKFLSSGGVFGTQYSWLTGVAFALDLFVGALVGFFLGGSANFDAKLDADLPLYMEFDQVTAVRFASNGPAFTVSASRGPDTSQAIPFPSFGVRERSLPHELNQVNVDGAWYYRHEVNFSYDSRADGWDFHWNDVGWQTVGIHDYQACADRDAFSGSSCGDPSGFNNIAGMGDHGLVFGHPGWGITCEYLLDPVFSLQARTDMERADDDPINTARQAYGALADTKKPPTEEEMVFPILFPAPATPTTTFVHTDVSYAVHYPDVFWYTACSTDPAVAYDRSNVAVGTDGTAYFVLPLCQESGKKVVGNPVFGFTLQAEYIGKQPRWTVRLPNPPGFESDDDGVATGDDRCEYYLGATCRVRVKIDPQLDGSIQVTMTTTRLFDDGTAQTVGTALAWVDASGHPGYDKPQAAEVPDFSSGTALMGKSGNATLDPTAVNAGPYGCVFFICPSYQWVFGDGTKSAIVRMTPKNNTPGAVVHRYPLVETRRGGLAGGPYHTILVIYDVANEVTQTRHFTVKADPRLADP